MSQTFVLGLHQIAQERILGKVRIVGMDQTKKRSEMITERFRAIGCEPVGHSKAAA